MRLLGALWLLLLDCNMPDREPLPGGCLTVSWSTHSALPRGCTLSEARAAWRGVGSCAPPGSPIRALPWSLPALGMGQVTEEDTGVSSPCFSRPLPVTWVSQLKPHMPDKNKLC